MATIGVTIPLAAGMARVPWTAPRSGTYAISVALAEQSGGITTATATAQIRVGPAQLTFELAEPFFNGVGVTDRYTGPQTQYVWLDRGQTIEITSTTGFQSTVAIAPVAE